MAIVIWEVDQIVYYIKRIKPARASDQKQYTAEATTICDPYCKYSLRDFSARKTKTGKPIYYMAVSPNGMLIPIPKPFFATRGACLIAIRSKYGKKMSKHGEALNTLNKYMEAL